MYAVLAGVAVLTSVGIWTLMVVDEERSPAAASLEMIVKFTNLTVMLVAVVTAWIAVGSAAPADRTGAAVAHLTVLVMAVVTALVNAVLLGAGLPSGWWGVVDLAQHYVIPAAIVLAWATTGPAVDIARRRLGRVIVVPLAWLAFVLMRGGVTDEYPYDFLDPEQSGWPGVLTTTAAILVLLVVTALAFVAIDGRRDGRRG